jgi:hypothetical protein
MTEPETRRCEHCLHRDSCIACACFARVLYVLEPKAKSKLSMWVAEHCRHYRVDPPTSSPDAQWEAEQ